MTPDTLSVTEAAARLGVSPKTVYRRVASGWLIPGEVRIIRIDKVVKIPLAELDRHLGVERSED